MTEEKAAEPRLACYRRKRLSMKPDVRLRSMRVRTSTIIDTPPSSLWPSLCSSRMDPRIPAYFRLGIPKPVECRLPDGHGGVGARRQCVSNIGVIHQRITHWQEPEILRFQMEDTTLYFRPCVTAIAEEFLLEPVETGQTKVTRTTDITVTGVGSFAKALVMCAGMKCVHRYVFKNWARRNTEPYAGGNAAPPRASA
ncbi:MAG: hypothetical protein O2857_27130 [Planctomycetota bacterium]|nr:hypothetical protein [Planctomycetota bacterium]